MSNNSINLRSGTSRRPTPTSGNSNSSSSTEEYDIPENALNNRNRLEPSIIDLNETQEDPNMILDEEDDDVILVPQHIETIDLCTQAPVGMVFPRNLQNQIIDITDSPAAQVPLIVDTPRRTRPIWAISEVTPGVREDPGPSRTLRANNRATPYGNNPGPSKESSTKPRAARTMSFDESFSSQMSAIKINCPICLESVKERDPVTTMCGHIFCKLCLRASMQTNKTCPMCKKKLPAKSPFIPIFI